MKDLNMEYMDVLIVASNPDVLGTQYYAVVCVQSDDPHSARDVGLREFRRWCAEEGLPFKDTYALYSGSPGQFDHMIGKPYRPEISEDFCRGQVQ
jgi:hypothetical protein